MTDSTPIKANASLDSLVPLLPQKKVSIQQNTGLCPPPPRKINNSTHISKTDPDARLAHKKGTAHTLKYKVHHSIDDYKRIIIDCYVTPGSVHESQPYIERLHHILKTYNILFKEVVADRAYGSAEILNQLIGEQIKPYIPWFSSRSGSASPKVSEGFLYNADRDVFRCVNQITLFPSSHVDKGLKRYSAPTKECRACAKTKKCKAKIVKKSGKRYVLRSVFQELYARVTENMKHPAFLKKLQERMWKMEGIIAEAKTLHGLSQAKYRRLEKVQIQALMTAIALNIKRIQAIT
ncbi:transposase [Candidatus Paracaedibacter symbiosus]|uniref:transposase n=1 Tax=Candidatus Paracaedibacter symbiosus TaxID=244582 RepID=UPI001E3624A2|nr:transposase [Candidatus Paracaedibacter symbiosus]